MTDSVAPASQQQQQHGCVLYNITFPSLDPPPATGQPKYPPDPATSYACSSSAPGLFSFPSPTALPPPQRPPDLSVPGREPRQQQQQQQGASREQPTPPSQPQYCPRIFQVQPLRQLAAIPSAERVESLSALSSPEFSPSSVTFLRMDGTTSAHGLGDSAVHALSRMRNLEVLVLRSMSMSRLDWLRFPLLRYCDLAGNKVKSVRECEGLCRRSPRLESLNLLHNPVSSKPDLFSRVISLLPDLTVLNETPISVSVRCSCLSTASSSPLHYRWDLALASVPQIAAMHATPPHTFQPTEITRLELDDQDLAEFHVAPFTSLEVLSLRRNLLTELRGSGIERLTRLTSLDLSDNRMYAPACLSVLSFLKSLLVLKLAGNKFDEGSRWRDWAVYYTRNSRGTNVAPGISVLDAEEITTTRRVAALKACQEGMKEDEREDPEQYRWWLTLVESFGADQVGSLASCGHCHMQAKSLRFCDLSVFGPSRLEVLCLASNDLDNSPPIGLSSFLGLRVLDLSGNPRLKPQVIVRVLATSGPFRALESLSVARTPEDNSPKRRAKILVALVQKCCRLHVLNGLPVGIRERVAAVSEITAKERNCSVSDLEVDMEKYRSDLAIVLSCAESPLLSYEPQYVAQLVPQDPRAVVSLKRWTTDAGLKSQYLSLGKFEFLEELDLSGNEIADPSQAGIPLLHRLRTLDLSRNRINRDPAELASLVDEVGPSLSCVKFQDNPCTKDEGWRRKFLQASKCASSLGTLKEVDREVSIDERMESLSKEDQEQAELTVRFAHVLLYRAPGDRRLWGSVSMLDLRGCRLSTLDVAGFPNLRSLLLRVNRIRTVAAVKGLETLRCLSALDLRDNDIQDSLENLASLCLTSLSSVQSVGLSGDKNRWSCTPAQSMPSSFSLRMKFIWLMTPLWRTIRYPLGLLDDQEITVSEIIDVSSAADPKYFATSSTTEHYRFKISLIRKIPSTVALLSIESLTELKLEWCGLTVVNFAEMPRLVRLSLAHNELHGDHLISGGVDRLTDLRALDVSDNRIKDKAVIKKLLVKLTALEAFWIFPNPCLPKGLEDAAAARKKLLDHRLKSKLPPLRLFDGKLSLPPAATGPGSPFAVQRSHGSPFASRR